MVRFKVGVLMDVGFVLRQMYILLVLNFKSHDHALGSNWYDFP
jgi:hypothetical protein